MHTSETVSNEADMHCVCEMESVKDGTRMESDLEDPMRRKDGEVHGFCVGKYRQLGRLVASNGITVLIGGSRSETGVLFV